MRRILFNCLIILLVFTITDYAAIGTETNGLSLNSPNDKINVAFYLDSNKGLNYTIYLNNKPILGPSPLSVDINNVIIGKNTEILDTSIKGVDEVYNVPIGKSSKVRNTYREGRLNLKSNNIFYDIIFRVYNDGVAFRYSYPKQSILNNIAIEKERSSFRFLSDYEVYAMKLNISKTPTGYNAYSYEDHFNKMNLSDISEDMSIAMPLLIKGDGFYAAITEAGLRDYTGVSLQRDINKGYTLVTQFNKGKDTDIVNVKSKAPFVSPWRVVMIGESLATFVESNIILNLNDESAIKDTSWIQPGKSTWPWWTGQAMSTLVFKEYIDFASEHNVPYLIIDAGWYCPEDVAWSDPLNQDATKITAKDLDLAEVIGYGKNKNVKIILWIHGATLQKQLDEALKTYSKWGVSGIKVDDWGREDQEWVNFWWEVAEKAASYKMVVDFHGTYKPTGIRKAYPNVLTREAVAGLEQSKWGDKCNLEHEVTIPFTRMLAGPMDFTPGAVAREWFGDKFQVEGTASHQLAMYVVYESPLQMLVDYPDAYENNKEALSFLEIVPTIWDETRLLDGEVGDYVIVARRSGENWFIGAMTDEKPRQFSIPLDFLGDGEYNCDIYTDSSKTLNDPTYVEVTTTSIRKGSNLSINLISGGGFAAYINKK